jgi:hypothetical protein
LGIAIVTGSINNATESINFTTGALNTFSGSTRIELNSIEAYTASLKSVGIVSSSTQISNYYKFAETASANTFYGTQTIVGNLHLSSTSPLLYNGSNTNAMLFGFFDGSSIYGPYYQIFGSNYSNVSQRGSAEFVFDSRNGGFSGFNVAEFNGSTWLRKFRVSPYGAEVTGSFIVTAGITGSILATNGVVSSSNQIPELFPLMQATASLNTQTGSQNQINLGISIVTGSLNSQTASQDLINYNNSVWTGSVRAEINDIGAYTSSLKAVAIVSSSTQVVNYNLFALTASNNIYYGENTFTNKVTHTNGYVVLTEVSKSLDFSDDTAAGNAGVPLGGLYRNGNFIMIRIS